MIDENNHGACVNAWMDRSVKGLPSEQQLHVFEQGFASLWQRAHLTLGDVTLTAIVDRVLYTAVEQFPILSPLTVEATGLRSQELQGRAASLRPDELVGAIRFVLVEFLTVLGKLTAEILTPALHSELERPNAEQHGEEEGA
jgi:hypothetical protein